MGFGNEKHLTNQLLIVSQEEAEAAEKNFSNKKKTWRLKAQNVRDFAFATSRKFIYECHGGESWKPKCNGNIHVS